MLSIEPLTFSDALVLNDISYRYPDTEKWALNKISMSIKQHETIGIVGASGAGKTTLIDIILGLLTPEGQLTVDNVTINHHNVRAWQRNIGYVPQSIFLLDGTIASNIAWHFRKYA